MPRLVLIGLPPEDERTFVGSSATGFDSFFSYDRILSDRRFWCSVQLCWALIGVVFFDSTLPTDDVGLVAMLVIGIL
jgi:hypothetical protein